MLLERLLSLWCRRFDHRMTPWFDATGPDETKARFCVRCGLTLHMINGEEVRIS